MEHPDYAVLHPAGRIEYGTRRPGQSIYQAIKPHLDDIGTQGMRRLRAWYCDSFGHLPPNPLADRVLTAIGYHHPTGWRGPVALSMEEDGSGDCPPLTAEIRATLDELTTPT